MSKQKYETLLKITNRAIELLVVIKKAIIAEVHQAKYPRLVPSLDASIAELSEYRLGLKQKIKGQTSLTLSESLNFLLEELKDCEDKELRKKYINKLSKLASGFLAGGEMEGKNERI